MTRATNILNKLQLTLTKQYNKEAMYGPAFISHYPSDGLDDQEDDYIDVPDAVDTQYVTHRGISLPKGKKAGSNSLPFPADSLQQEAKKKDEDDEEDAGLSPEQTADMAADAAEEDTEEATGESDEEVDAQDLEVSGIQPDETGGEEAAADPDMSGAEADPEAGGDMGADPSMGGDMGGGDMGADPSMGGDMGGMGDMGMAGQQEEEKTSSELGRIYELKKIYSRLTSIESYLSDESSKDLLEIRVTVSQSIELFEIISANFNSFKEKLDEIIITYYKFISEVYSSVRDYYKKQSNSGDK
jgi:hypothetical protein